MFSKSRTSASNHAKSRSNTGIRRATNDRIALEQPLVQRVVHPFTDGLEHGEPMMLVGVPVTFPFEGLAVLGRLAERDSIFELMAHEH